MLVWADVWLKRRNVMTCKSTSAGAVQLESHQIEAWSVLKQVASFSSDENELVPRDRDVERGPLGDAGSSLE